MLKEFCDICGREAGSLKFRLSYYEPYTAKVEYEDGVLYETHAHKKQILLCDKCAREASRAISCWQIGKRVFTKGQYAVIERAVKEQENE